MPLTLEQYGTYLDHRKEPWPAPPEVDRPKARPHLVPLPDVRVVLWNVYGTLVAITGGELWFEHPQEFIMNVALDKCVQEFKMWSSMSRKPGQPSEYLRQMYSQLLLEKRSVTGGNASTFPEVASDRLWEGVLKKLLQKDYKFDAGFFGSLNEFSRKVAFFFHSSLQGTQCYPGAAATLRALTGRGVRQGLLADGQCFTTLQLQRGLAQQDPEARLDQLLDESLCWLSYDVGYKKPSRKLFTRVQEALNQRGLSPDQVLHVGSRIPLDLAPARRLGLRTALFAGDKASLQATPEQLKDPNTRPDVMLTELSQLAEVVTHQG